nr:peptide chain release factor 3 [Saprospiraceae bacterium]
QLFTKLDNNRKIIGTVGALQFEVIQYRLEHEYGAKCDYEPINLYKACWVKSTDKKVLGEFEKRRKSSLAHDKRGKLVFMAESAWALQRVQEAHPDIEFTFKSEV